MATRFHLWRSVGIRHQTRRKQPSRQYYNLIIKSRLKEDLTLTMIKTRQIRARKWHFVSNPVLWKVVSAWKGLIESQPESTPRNHKIAKRRSKSNCVPRYSLYIWERFKVAFCLLHHDLPLPFRQNKSRYVQIVLDMALKVRMFVGRELRMGRSHKPLNKLQVCTSIAD